MTTVQVTEDVLRALAQQAPAGRKIVTLYVDLDRARFSTPAARDAQLNSLLTDARAQADALDLSHRDAEDVAAAIRSIQAELDGGWPADGAQGLAIFAAGNDWLRRISLPHSVQSHAALNDTPMLGPLTEQIVRETWGVLIVDRRSARFLRGAPGALTEVGEINDVLQGKHKAGGWSQARFQRSIEQDVANHLKHTSSFIHAEHKRGMFDVLVLAAADELRNDVLDTLPSSVRDRIVATIDNGIMHASVPDIEMRIQEVAREREAEQEREAIERLRRELATKGRATQGTAGVLRALNERRVEILLIEPDASPGGAVCPTCGLLEHQAMACPADGTAMEPRTDVLDLAIEKALEQSADVHAVTTRSLDAADGIAALTRY